MTDNMQKYRKDFPVIKEQNIIYFDNAASSLKPVQVVNAICKYYNTCPVNVHRGIHRLSMDASIIFEETHTKIANFFNCDSKEAILTSNSTDSINTVMYMLYNSDYFKKGDEVLLSIAEHHASIVPWLFLKQKIGIKLKFVNLKKDLSFDFEDFKKKLTNKTKLVSIAHITNTTGTIYPIKKIIKQAHLKKSLVLVDASQSAPHKKLDFKKSDADFLVFTAHKMCGPTGIGCLIGKKKHLERFSPAKFGGDMIKDVTMEKAEWNSLPHKFEAGTPNISGAFGFSAALDYLSKIGMKNIEAHDAKLTKYAYDKLKKLKNIEVVNCKNLKVQAPTILFRAKTIDVMDLSALLDDVSGIATRAGMHCAQPIVSSLDKNGLLRASFYFYNTKKEIDVFIKTLKQITEN